MPVENSRASARVKQSAISMEHSFGKRIVFTLVGILVAYAIVLVATMIRNNLQSYEFIGQSDKAERTLVIEGEGKIQATPDVAVVSMGMQSKGVTVAEAQGKNTETMNTLIKNLQGLGIAKAHIQTSSYNVYPKTKYVERTGEVPDGFEVDQTVTVKVYDLTKVGDVIAQAGALGLNSVGGVQFKIDDMDVYRAKARDLALRKAKAKAVRLAQSLGVQLVSIVSYNEYEPGSSIPMDAGGPIMMAEKSSISPSIEAGSNDVIMHVTMTYEIK
jgi:uncharacterized protein YggE